jgi:hypothetical protein
LATCCQLLATLATVTGLWYQYLYTLGIVIKMVTYGKE